MSPRDATGADVPAIARLINRAYEVERFFVSGDRVSEASLHDDMRSGRIFVVENGDGSAHLRACVYLAIAGSRGYFGMLAVDPASQGAGLGRALIAFAESTARAAGATHMTITVVNVREDLLGFYGRLGYTVTGTAPYVNRPVSQPVHFILMEKDLYRPNIDVPL